MKLFLVNPIFRTYVSTPSLGLGFIGTHIKKHTDCDVEIIEPSLQKLSENGVLEKICNSKNKIIVGLTCYTESRFDCFEFGKKVKVARPDAKLIVGGVHVDTLDELILRYYPFVDIVARGESEETVLDIIRNKPLKDVPGITWKENGNIVRNVERKLQENLDDLDYDYSLLSPWVDGWKDLEIPAQFQKTIHLPIIVSRGCWFRCSFCGSFNYWRNKFRVVSSEKIIQRMKCLVKKYNVGYFRFYDALFLGNEEKRIFEFCDLLRKNDLKTTFRVDLRIGTKPAVLKVLRDVGCIVIGFGVESGSDRVLKSINKGINRKQIVETCKVCRTLGYWTIGFFMISMPTEETEDIKKTFSIFNLFDELNLQFFKVHPGTPFYDQLKYRNEINDEVWFDKAKSEPEYFYCKELFPSAKLSRKTVDFIFLKYYLLPMKLKHYIKVGLIHPVKTIRKVTESIRLPFVGKLFK